MDAVQTFSAPFQLGKWNLRVVERSLDRPLEFFNYSLISTTTIFDSFLQRFVGFWLKVQNANSSNSFLTLLIPRRLAIGA